MTRRILIRQGIADAVQAAFKEGSRRLSDGTVRPFLSVEDCQHIADVAHNTVEKVGVGVNGRRTIHGGRH